jgi:hypothetical protein
MPERYFFSLCRRPNITPEQSPDDRLQDGKHCRRIVARSVPGSSPKTPDEIFGNDRCSIRDLPRLIGEGVSKSTEGVPIEFTYRLIAYTVDEDGVIDLVGSLKWSGGGVGMSRVVKMSRN